MNLPIPTHLQNYFVPIGDSNVEYEVTGNIYCTCGNKDFQVAYSNDKQIIKLICTKCGHEILLFDISKHGWNGYVCHEDFLDKTLPFHKYFCPECKKDSFNVTVYIESQGKQDFIEECINFEDGFSPDDWVNAFECISVSLLCTNCKTMLKDWAGPFETM